MSYMSELDLAIRMHARSDDELYQRIRDEINKHIHGELAFIKMSLDSREIFTNWEEDMTKERQGKWID